PGPGPGRTSPPGPGWWTHSRRGSRLDAGVCPAWPSATISLSRPAGGSTHAPDSPLDRGPARARLFVRGDASRTFEEAHDPAAPVPANRQFLPALSHQPATPGRANRLPGHV